MKNSEIVNVGKQAAQGDLLITRIAKLPAGLVEQKAEKGQLIVAHSETGHHHCVDAKRAKFYTDPKDAMVAYLKVDGLIDEMEKHADLVHQRSFDTHKTLRAEEGTYEIRRQREHTPEGWRRVED